MHTGYTKGRVTRHIVALCLGFLPLLATVGTILSSQTPTQSQPETRHNLASQNLPAEYNNPTQFTFPVINVPARAPATTTIVRQETDTPSVLFNHDFTKLFDRLQFDTASVAFSTHGLPESPDDLLPIVSPTAVMTLSHPHKTARVYTVVLDPGHGGSDPGTIGVDGLLEKELTLGIANRVKNLLLPHPNINIRLTRSNDRGFSRANRVKRIRMADGDLLVSLHLNNIPQRDLTVVESFYAARENILESEQERQLKEDVAHNGGMIKTSSREHKDYAYTAHSRRIAEILQENIYREVVRDNPEAINAGIKKETLYTLTRSEMPGTLIELTCLSNKSEEQRLKSGTYRQKIAESIAEGLLEYFSTPAVPMEGLIAGI